MVNITQADLRILEYLSRSGGRCTGLLGLSLDLEMAYAHSMIRVSQMERIGLLNVQHLGKGRPMIIQMVPGCPYIPTSLRGMSW